MMNNGNLTITEVLENPSMASDKISDNANLMPGKISNKKLSPEDQKIYQLCKKYGADALEARRKFAGLLPEVFRRRIYEKKGFDSIEEFAAKLAGMSQPQVRLVLSLEKKYDDKPVLKSLLINGEVSVNKLARVAAVATTENQEFLADQVRLLPQAAIETLVRDIKFKNNVPQNDHKNRNNSEPQKDPFETQGDSQKPLFVVNFLRARAQSARRAAIHSCCGQNVQAKLELDENVVSELLELQEKGIDINQLIKGALENRRQEIAHEKEEIVSAGKVKSKKPSRYIPVRTRNIILKEYGTKCSIPGCNKPSQQTHHSQKFALAGFHDPHFMPRLCSEHHKIAHTIDVKFHQVRKSVIQHTSS